MRYRPEIDGLRAIAVLAVMMFHAGFGKAAGGYVGVDVFFVISGYLITQILTEALAGGRFDLWGFYERRARRLLPALGVVMLCSLPFAWLWMFPFEFQGYGKSLVTMASYTANFGFWIEEDYFSVLHQMKPFGHGWSLAVEEQFYLVYPLLLWAAWRLAGRRFLLPVVTVTALASLGAAVWMMQVDRSGAFFLLPFRAWELLAGAICALVPVGAAERRGAGLWALGGLAAIGGAMLVMDNGMSGPGPLMLIPVLGTVAVLRHAVAGTLAARLLSLRPLVGVGLVSYSAYLWHQPVLAFARWRLDETLSNPLKGALLVLSLVLAAVTWRFVEQPVRRGWPAGRLPLFGGAFAASALFVAVGFATYGTGGFPGRFDAKVQTALLATRDSSGFNRCRGVPLDGTDARCVIGDVGRKTVDFVLIGDSFAAALADGVDLAAKAAGLRGYVSYVSACPAVQGLGGNWYVSRRACAAFQDSMVDQVAATGTRHVILGGAWRVLSLRNVCELERVACRLGRPVDTGVVADAMAETVAAFRARGITVTVVDVPPGSLNDVPRATAKALMAGGTGDVQVVDDPAVPTAMAAALAKVDPPVELISIRPFFCTGERCDVARAGVALLRDSGHITATTSRALAPILAAAFDDVP